MTQLIDALIAGNNQTPTNNPLSGGAGLSSLRQMVTNPLEDFIMTLLEITDGKGVLDQSFGPETVEDTTDLAGDPDPLEFLDKEELILLIQKFDAIPEPQRSQLEQQLRAEFSPKIVQRLDAVRRFVQREQR